jgi:hypothetical protein
MAAAALVLAISGCGLDVAGESEGTPIQIKLDFCANDTPIWFAFQDATDPFEVITPDASGTFTFQSRSRVAIAYVRQRGNDFRTDLIFTTNEALAPLANLTCLEQGGAKQVNGTVTGHSATQLGLVSLSSANSFVEGGQSAWTLSQLVDRPLDLVASRLDTANGNQHANKTIIRRSLNPANGSTVAELAFATQGFAPVPSTINISGVGASDHGVLYSSFVTALGTSHMLTLVDSISDGPTAVETIPAGELTSLDYHKVSAVATSANGAVRTTDRYFRSPGTQGITIGPALIEPSVTVVGTTPHVRMRTQALGQIDYSTMMNMLYHQQTSTQVTEVSMSVTASYFSATPIEWNLPMPNFDGLPGWQNIWGLKTGPIDWRVTGYFGRPQVIFGAPPNATDGETIAYGSRSSSVTVNSVQAARLAAVGGWRPGHFGRLGTSGPR